MGSQDEVGNRLRLLVERIVEQMVEEPQALDVFFELEHGAVVLEVHVAERDRGRVIGRNGQVARSIRTIVDAVSGRHGVRCQVNLAPGMEER